MVVNRSLANTMEDVCKNIIVVGESERTMALLRGTENYSLSMNPTCSAPGSHTIYAKILPYLHEHPRECPRWTMPISRLLTEVTGLDSSEADDLPQKICVDLDGPIEPVVIKQAVKRPEMNDVC
ncbi:conserved hypothetical protein [Culex quinquefasciatus]|uniref:Uncharacterized protein n=1 Tax=Culex quinquefasciatus TaxID=7176 RepID=B0X9F9_CULQU|nr:conserved hypothetical protein [Culex quinquefasciatus]|eukprot:XP_001866288.1 conserved hypothetical protein [Culex quinquefasciatus]